MHVDEEGSVPIEVPVYGLSAVGAPVTVAVLDSQESHVVSLSEMAVIVPAEAVK